MSFRHHTLLSKRRAAADARNAARAKRTPQQQLALIAQRRGDSKREVARLQAVAKAGKPKVGNATRDGVTLER